MDTVYYKNDLLYATFLDNPLLVNLHNNKKYETNLDVIFCVLNFLKTPNSIENIITFLQGEFQLSEEMSNELVKNLVENDLIINQKNDGYNKKLSWKEMDWEPSIIHYTESRNINFEDIGGEDDYSKKQKEYKSFLEVSSPPEFYKNYTTKYIKLPEIKNKMDVPISEVLLNRKTSRVFKDTPLSIEDLSYILFYGTFQAREIRKYVSNNFEKDPALFTNSLFSSNELYLIISNVRGVEKGIYHYDMELHGLHQLKTNIDTSDIGYYCYGQPEMKNAAVVLFISAEYEKYMWRYRHERAYRNLLMDVSQLAQSIILATTSNGKKSFLTPALRDTELVNLFDLVPLKEDIRYLVAIGE